MLANCSDCPLLAGRQPQVDVTGLPNLRMIWAACLSQPYLFLGALM
jgi:hypothetical protein